MKGRILEMWSDEDGLHVLTEESCAVFPTLEDFYCAMLEQLYDKG